MTGGIMIADNMTIHFVEDAMNSVHVASQAPDPLVAII